MQPTFARELGQAEREARVRNDVGPVVLEPRRGEPIAQWILLADADAVPAVELLERESLRGILGMQVEWEPRDLGVELAPRLLGRYLAEPTEGSDVVAPDKDRVLNHTPYNARAAPCDSPSTL